MAIDYLGDIFHGVTVTEVDSGSRPIHLPSTSVIGLVDSYTPGAGLVTESTPTLITSYRQAVVAFGAASNVAKACQAIFEQASAIVVAVGVDEADTSGSPATLTTAIIGADNGAARTGLQALLDAKSILNQQPRLIIAPGHSATAAVAAAMVVIAGKLRAIAIVDGPNTDDTAATAYATTIGGSKRLFMVDPGVTVWDTTTSATVQRHASPYAAGLFAFTDAQYGFWASPSNKAINGITGTHRPIEFLDNDPTCRANLLNRAGIATIIRQGSYVLWGNRTLASDEKWSFVTRVRILDIVADALLVGHRWAVDRAIGKRYAKEVTEGLNKFLRDLKAQGAVIDFEVYLDPELNTPTQIYDYGRVYWNIRFTDAPPAENPIFRLEVTDQWITEILDVRG